MSGFTADLLGFIGMILEIYAYGYATLGHAPSPLRQHGANLLGAALLTTSLVVHVNLAALVLELFWGAIAVWGLAKALQERRA
jgi:multisubunit Na+/H+ antiporter MnhC subunit